MSSAKVAYVALLDSTRPENIVHHRSEHRSESYRFDFLVAMSTTFSPTTAELALVSIIFSQADPQKRGILTGDVAVKVFAGAKLESNILGDIWSIADEDNNGWLPRKGVAIAVRLIGWAQKGEKITKTLVNKRKYWQLEYVASSFFPIASNSWSPSHY
jgi:Cytoskeletal-regulatory complex EF hand